jgi:hypothetical protein
MELLAWERMIFSSADIRLAAEISSGVRPCRVAPGEGVRQRPFKRTAGIDEGFAELIADCLSNLPVASVIRTELTLIEIKRAPLRRGPWM